MFAQLRKHKIFRQWIKERLILVVAVEAWNARRVKGTKKMLAPA